MCVLPEECSVLRLGFDFGTPDADLLDMARGMPLELQDAMRRLAARLPTLKRRTELPTLPTPDLERWRSDRVYRTVHKVTADGTMQTFQFNDNFQTLHGAHAEEIAVRIARQDLPQHSSQYRMLCYHLHLLLGLFGLFPMGADSPPPPLLLVARPNMVAAAKLPPTHRHHPANLILRVTFQMYGDGFATSSGRLSAEEFDRIVHANPAAKSVFSDCSLSGAELMQATNLHQEERLERMAASEQGRRRLRCLADKIVRLFQLDGEANAPAAHRVPERELCHEEIAEIRHGL